MFDSLIIGAGPAGCVAAIELARAGARVALVDRHDFPRDKTCGDALLPDALAALGKLGLAHAITDHGRMLRGICVYAPNGRPVSISGACACVPRLVLDNVLRAEAIRAGASFFPRHRLKAPIADGAVRGARFTASDGREVALRAATTLLATGAAAEALKVFDVCRRVTPSAVAARAYFKIDSGQARAFDHLCISYDKEICPGYGWIFPGPDDVFNVGVGYFYDGKTCPTEINLRSLFARFIERSLPAAELMRYSRQLSPLKGAPLRTALCGADLAVPGLLVIGEAAGLTYSFSGEGIGKAMESGAIAAAAIRQHLETAASAPDLVSRKYAALIRESFMTRFRAYKVAQQWLARPALVNLIAWRATRSRFVMSQLEGMFQETVAPETLFSAPGFARALVS